MTMNEPSPWLGLATMAALFASTPACSSSDDEEGAGGATAATSQQAAAGPSGQGGATTGQGGAAAATGQGGAAATTGAGGGGGSGCPDVCSACAAAMLTACETCTTDPDCDSTGEACAAAAELESQFGCEPCASGLAQEAACDGT